MSEVKDYTEGGVMGDTHYNGVDSWYGKEVHQQLRQQPKYCMPGEVGGGLQGAKSNEQKGP